MNKASEKVLRKKVRERWKERRKKESRSQLPSRRVFVPFSFTNLFLTSEFRSCVYETMTLSTRMSRVKMYLVQNQVTCSHFVERSSVSLCSWLYLCLLFLQMPLNVTMTELLWWWELELWVRWEDWCHSKMCRLNMKLKTASFSLLKG